MAISSYSLEMHAEFNWFDIDKFPTNYFAKNLIIPLKIHINNTQRFECVRNSFDQKHGECLQDNTNSYVS